MIEYSEVVLWVEVTSIISDSFLLAMAVPRQEAAKRLSERFPLTTNHTLCSTTPGNESPTQTEPEKTTRTITF